MSGSFLTQKNKELNKLSIQIENELKKAEEMFMSLDSDIIIKKENDYYVAYYHVHS